LKNKIGELKAWNLEQFTGNMISGTDAGRRHVNLAGIGLGVGDELGSRLDRDGWIHLHDKRLAVHPRDRDDVADQIEIKFLVERGVDSVSSLALPLAADTTSSATDWTMGVGPTWPAIRDRESAWRSHKYRHPASAA
jgi:hypothetical protein